MQDDILQAETEETAIGETSDESVAVATIAETPPSELQGYVLVGSTTESNLGGGDDKIELDDLLPTTEIEHLSGISCSMDKPYQSAPHGTIRVRIIQDAGGRAFVWRKDDTENGVTRFKVSFKHQAA